MSSYLSLLSKIYFTIDTRQLFSRQTGPHAKLVSFGEQKTIASINTYATNSDVGIMTLKYNDMWQW